MKFVFIFIGVTGFIYLWCMARPLHSTHTRKPRLSPYPELDLAIKLVGSGYIGGKVLSDEIHNSVCAVTDHLEHVRLYVRRPGNHEDLIPMGTVNNRLGRD